MVVAQRSPSVVCDRRVELFCAETDHSQGLPSSLSSCNRPSPSSFIVQSVRKHAGRSHIMYGRESQLRVPHSLLPQHSLRGKRRYNTNSLSSRTSAQSAVGLSVAPCLSIHPQSWFSLSDLRPFDGVSACSRMIIPTPQHHATSTRIQPLDPISI